MKHVLCRRSANFCLTLKLQHWFEILASLILNRDILEEPEASQKIRFTLSIQVPIHIYPLPYRDSWGLSSAWISSLLGSLDYFFSIVPQSRVSKSGTKKLKLKCKIQVQKVWQSHMQMLLIVGKLRKVIIFKLIHRGLSFHQKDFDWLILIVVALKFYCISELLGIMLKGQLLSPIPRNLVGTG